MKYYNICHLTIYIRDSYSGYQSQAPSNNFFPFRKLCFGGRQSNVSMTIMASGVSRTTISMSILRVSELLFHLYLTLTIYIRDSYSGYQSQAPSNNFFPFRKLCFGGRQSNVSMTIMASGVSRTTISMSILRVSELLFHLYLTRR